MKLGWYRMEKLDDAIFQNLRNYMDESKDDFWKVYSNIWKDILQNDTISQRKANILEEDNYHSLTRALIRSGYLNENGKVIIDEVAK
jgi:hypothetical protein